MKIAVVVSRVPYPLEKGDKLRAYHQIKFLAQHHDVFLFCLDDKKTDPSALLHLQTFCREVHVYKLSKFKIILRLIGSIFSKLPFQVNYFFDYAISRKLRNQLQVISPDRIYCQLIRMTEYVKDLHGTDKTLDYMDVFSKGMERREHQAGIFIKPFIKAEYRRLLQYESRIFDYFEKKVIISKQDRDLIPHKEKNKIQIIPNGVDTEYFSPPAKREIKYQLLFHGNLSYSPNVECVRYIIEDILPALAKKNIRPQLLVSGASPASKIIKLCANHPQVHLAGYVDDVRTSYASSQILLAPFTTGTGLQNKILEGMAMGMTCITSYLCYNALENAINKEHVLVGATTDDYVQLIETALGDLATCEKTGLRARKYVEEQYSWKTANERLLNLIVQ